MKTAENKSSFDKLFLIQPEMYDPHPKNEEVNIGSPDIPVEEPKVDKPKISVKMVKKSNGDWSIKKVKNFSCEI